MATTRIEVVHVGSASRDLTSDDPRGWRLGGGVTYAALTTARLGLRTAALVGVDAAASSADELDLLRAAGVELVLVELAEGPVFDNRETPAGRQQVCHAVGRPLAVPNLPGRWLEATAWSLVPVAGEIDEGWAEAIPGAAYVTFGWQGILRELVAGRLVKRRPPTASALVARADLVGASHHDLAVGTSLAELSGFLHPGADLVISEGREGGLLVRVGREGPREVLRYPAAPVGREIDPTGAGDTFLAALLVRAIRADVAPRRGARGLDLLFAAAAGSCVVEGPGLAAVPDLEAVERRTRRIPRHPAVRPVRDEYLGEAPLS